MFGFVESIDSWRDFYMLTGSASATLVGLIFVAVTLHIDVIAEAKKSSDIRMLAEEIFINFLMILSFAFIFTVPSDTPSGIGYPLLILGTIQIVHTAALWLRFLRSKGEHRAFASSMILRGLLIPNTICYLTIDSYRRRCPAGKDSLPGLDGDGNSMVDHLSCREYLAFDDESCRTEAKPLKKYLGMNGQHCLRCSRIEMGDVPSERRFMGHLLPGQRPTGTDP